MRYRNIENGLALAGAILVIVGVLFAAASALADESGITATAVAIHDAAEASVSQAATAHAESAERAAERIARHNELDLDIRFYDHSSERVARR